MAKKAVDKKVAEEKLVRCMECEHSDCVRWHTNPVISICRVRKSFGRPYRMVALSTHQCKVFDKFKGVIKGVRQMDG